MGLNETIDPHDQMWESGPDWYFKVGEDAFDLIKRILALGRKPAIGSILDLPCGHGRVGRYLRAGFPEARITFCDLDLRGVEFCAKEFEGIALPSKLELSEVVFPQLFDLIWVGSLFTHIDAERTERWLHHLSKALAPNGVLVATFHGRWAIEVQKSYYSMIDGDSWNEIIKQYEAEGYGYAPYPSTTGENYGISLTRISRIASIVEQMEGVRMLAYLERGWGDNHDVLSIVKTDRLRPWPAPPPEAKSDSPAQAG